MLISRAAKGFANLAAGHEIAAFARRHAATLARANSCRFPSRQGRTSKIRRTVSLGTPGEISSKLAGSLMPCIAGDSRSNASGASALRRRFWMFGREKSDGPASGGIDPDLVSNGEASAVFSFMCQNTPLGQERPCLLCGFDNSRMRLRRCDFKSHPAGTLAAPAPRKWKQQFNTIGGKWWPPK